MMDSKSSQTAYKVSIQNWFKNTFKRKRTKILRGSCPACEAPASRARVVSLFTLKNSSKSNRRPQGRCDFSPSSNLRSCKWFSRKSTGGPNPFASRRKSCKKVSKKRRFSWTLKTSTFSPCFSKIKMTTSRLLNKRQTSAARPMRQVCQNLIWSKTSPRRFPRISTRRILAQRNLKR